MSYWMIITTMFWGHILGMYPTEDACEAQARKWNDGAWYSSATCVRSPIKVEEPHQH